MSTYLPLTFQAGDKTNGNLNLLTDDSVLVCRYLSLHASQYAKMKQRNILKLLRSQCLKGIKMNFTELYRNLLVCPLKCS